MCCCLAVLWIGLRGGVFVLEMGVDGGLWWGLVVFEPEGAAVAAVDDWTRSELACAITWDPLSQYLHYPWLPIWTILDRKLNDKRLRRMTASSMCVICISVCVSVCVEPHISHAVQITIWFVFVIWRRHQEFTHRHTYTHITVIADCCRWRNTTGANSRILHNAHRTHTKAYTLDTPLIDGEFVDMVYIHISEYYVWLIWVRQAKS